MIDKIIEGFARRGVRLYTITQITDGVADTRYITPASLCHNCYSVAKAFTVTALGLLYDEGKLSTDELIYDILRNSFPEKHDVKWERITLHELMLHKIGLERGFLDIDKEDITEYGTDDFLRFAFSCRLPGEPGTERVYSDAAYYILSRAVAKKSGKNLAEYLRTRLFNPLGFTEAAWSVCPRGYSMGATGLYIKTNEMARLGLLYLNDGVYNGKRILSEDWVNIVLTRGYELKRHPITEMESWSKGGMYGQMLYFSKKSNCVLAWNAYDKTGASKEIMDELGM